MQLPCMCVQVSPFEHHVSNSSVHYSLRFQVLWRPSVVLSVNDCLSAVLGVSGWHTRAVLLLYGDLIEGHNSLSLQSLSVPVSTLDCS